MADEKIIANSVEETTEVVEPETKVEIDTTDMPDSSGNKPDDGPGFVRKTMEKLGMLKPKTETTEETESDGEPISSDFIAAAKEAGRWTDDEIIDFASDKTDDELKELIPFMFEEEKLEPDKPAKQEENPKPQQTTPNEEVIKAIKEEIRKEFQGELDELKSKLSIVDETRKAQDSAILLNTVNEIFDEAGKEFEVFGQTEKLPVFPAGPKKGQYIPTSPQFKARNDVWSKAAAFVKAGASTKEAMQDALTWYKGKNLEKDVKRNLIKGLKKNETKLSAKRTSKETTPAYEDEEAYRTSFIKKEAERLGIKLDED